MLDPTLLHARALREFEKDEAESNRDPLRTARGVWHGLIAAAFLWIIGGVAACAIKGLF